MSSVNERYAMTTNRPVEFPDPACPRVEGRWLDFVMLSLATSTPLRPQELWIESWNGATAESALCVIKEGMMVLGEDNILVLEGNFAGSICLNTTTERHLIAKPEDHYFTAVRDLSRSKANGVMMRTLSRYSSSLPRLDEFHHISRTLLHGSSRHPAIRGVPTDLKRVGGLIELSLRGIQRKDPYASVALLIRLLKQALPDQFQELVHEDRILQNCREYDLVLEQYAWMIHQLSARSY